MENKEIKFNVVQQKNNLLKENFIIKMYENNTFLYCKVLNFSELLNFVQKDLKLNLSENYLLSKEFLKDLINIKLNNKEFIYL